jgi:hypothetical protein
MANVLLHPVGLALMAAAVFTAQHPRESGAFLLAGPPALSGGARQHAGSPVGAVAARPAVNNGGGADLWRCGGAHCRCAPNMPALLHS